MALVAAAMVTLAVAAFASAMQDGDRAPRRAGKEIGVVVSGSHRAGIPPQAPLPARGRAVVPAPDEPTAAAEVEVGSPVEEPLGPRAVDLGATGDVHHVFAPGSLVRAIASAQPGEAVVVHGGTYPYLRLRDVDPPAEVRIIAAPGEQVVVAGADIRRTSHLSFRGIQWSGGVYLRGTLDVRFKGGSSDVPPDVINFDVRDGCRYTVVEDLVMTGGWTHVNLNAATNAAAPVSTWIGNNDMGEVRQDHVIVNRGVDVYVQRNLIHGVVDSGEHSDGVQAVGVDGLYIDRNHMWTPRAARDAARDDNDHGIMLDHDPASGRYTRNVRIANNLIHDWFGIGIAADGAEDVRIFNNTVYDNGPGGSANALNLDPEAGHAMRDIAVWNNVFDRVFVSASELALDRNEANFVADGSGPPGVDELSGSPGFVSEADADYRPAPGSPLIGSGTARGAATVDLFGYARLGAPGRGALGPYF